MRYAVRDMHTLRNLAIHLLTNTASLTSFQRLAKRFNVSTVMIQNYCTYLQDTFLIDLLPIFTLKTSERQRNPQKAHVADLGIRQRISLTHSIDQGKNIETLVYHRLIQQETHSVFYWKKTSEIDFLLRQGNQTTHLIQVVSEGLEQPDIFKREIDALNEAKKSFRKAKKIIVTAQTQIFDQPINKTHVLPLWHLNFLLDNLARV